MEKKKTNYVRKTDNHQGNFGCFTRYPYAKLAAAILDMALFDAYKGKTKECLRNQEDARLFIEAEKNSWRDALKDLAAVWIAEDPNNSHHYSVQALTNQNYANLRASLSH